ncbi:hypothetical protein BASA81_003558 [Batrachochytrium salamandrivorans]|nr:hypothetical protein BASA81_003558 [Batrachochytrium salamandrivorans]
MSFWENKDEEAIMELIRAQEEQLQLDEAIARSLAISPPKLQEDELSDYALCMQIQQQEEETARRLQELKQRRADLQLKQFLAREEEDEWKVISNALRKEEDEDERKMISNALRKEEDKEFPELGAKPSMTKPSLTKPTVAARVPVEREALKPTEEICAQLVQQYPSIPLEFVQYVATEAKGRFDYADTLVFQFYPNEYRAHRQQLQQAAIATSGVEVAAPSSLVNIKITKIKGRKLQDLDGSNNDGPRSDDSIRKAYLALAGRKGGYNVEDLRRAYMLWGESSPLLRSRPRKGGGGGGGEEQTTLNELYYQSARWDSVAIVKQISLDRAALSALCRLPEQDQTMQALEAKIADQQQQLLASQLEAADMLFVRINPKLFSLVSQRANSNRPLQVDLHTMHANEAVDRVRVVLQYAYQSGWLQIKLITGKGKHSANMQAKLGPEIQAYLAENELGHVQDVQLLDGAIHVSLKNWQH